MHGCGARSIDERTSQRKDRDLPQRIMVAVERRSHDTRSAHLFPREQPTARGGCELVESRQFGLASMVRLLITLIPCLLLMVGVCALAFWGERQPDSLAELIERLIGKRT